MNDDVIGEIARDIQDMFHRFETQNSLTHLGKVNELIP